MSQQAMGADGPDKSWIERSNVFTHMLLDVHLEHSPEEGSQQGLAKFDERISNPTLGDQLAERRARTDFRLPPEKYALKFEEYGIDIPPARIAAMAHAAFVQYQAEMAPLAAQIAKANGYSSGDYRTAAETAQTPAPHMQETEAALGPKFDQRKFHDFILGQGLLPPDLMRKAVLDGFVPSQR